MNLKIPVEILAKKEISHRNWYLCKGNLLDYLTNLKPEFYEFAIQRRIVKNQYLDSLYNTIKSGDPIPVLTLTYSINTLEVNNKTFELDMSKVEILDGLQRTFRLWSYKILADNYIGERDKEIGSFARRLKEINPLLFESGVITTSFIKKIIENNEITTIIETFKSFEIFFIVWAGLSEIEIVQKMLVLNAGQKAVSKTHQFELLFLHFFEKIKNRKTQVQLFREKDKNAGDIKNGRREIGQFMFSSFIVGLQSFIEQKPLKISTENPIGLEIENENDPEVYNYIFNPEFLVVFLELLLSLDKIIFATEGQSGKEWFVKETTLSGVLSAIGNSIDFRTINSSYDLIIQTESAFQKLERAIMNRGFNIDNYKSEFSNISSRAINFGTFIRKAIMEYTASLMQDSQPNWHQLFIKTQESK